MSRIFRIFNWQLSDWKSFKFNKKELEEDLLNFSEGIGHSKGLLEGLSKQGEQDVFIEIISTETISSSAITEKSNKETTQTTLKWVHIAISNAKRTLLGIFHKIKGKYLQNYLDEFCYKLNRRYFGNKLFDRLILAVAENYG